MYILAVRSFKLQVHRVQSFPTHVGLQIQLSNKSTLPPVSFDFTWAKFNQTPRAIDWRPLALQEVTYPHIRLHHLQERDGGLADFLSMMDSIPATMAVVLVNTENDYRSVKLLMYMYKTSSTKHTIDRAKSKQQ